MLPQIAGQLPTLAATIAPLAGEVLEALKVVAAIGYRAVQLSATQVGTRPKDLDISGRKDLTVQLRRFGLSCAGLDLWIPSSHFIDPAFVDRAIDAVSQSITLAAALGRCSVSLALPARTDRTQGNLNDVRAAVDACAQREGVQVADHGVDAATGVWTPSSSGFVGVGIDPAVLLGANQDVCASVTKIGARIVCARVVDLLRTGMRGPPGEPHDARLDLVAYMATLASISLYTSPVVDARQWSDARAGLRITLQRWSGGSSG